MITLRRGAVAAALAFVTAGGIVAAPWSYAGQHLVVHALVTSANLVDNAPAGFGPGDLLTFAGPVVDDEGATIGRVDGQCTVTTAQGQAYCTPVVTLAGGQILLAGSRSITSLRGTLAVVGGTGRYHEATGDAQARDKDLTHSEGWFDVRLDT
jgi:hypothetical protein